MKFQQLPQGARFEYEGQVYVKVGPLTAASESGRQRMIPRFAVLKPVEGSPIPPPPPPAKPVDRAKVLAALEAYQATCLDWLAQAELAPDQAQGLRACLSGARQRFMDDLG